MADIAEVKAERYIDNFILAELKSLRVSPICLDDPTPILANKYLDNSQKNATYPILLRRPSEMDTKEFNMFKKKPLNSKYKTTIFSIKTTKIYQCVELLMIL